MKDIEPRGTTPQKVIRINPQEQVLFTRAVASKKPDRKGVTVFVDKEPREDNPEIVLGSQVRTFRTAHHLSLQQFVQGTDLHVGTLSEVERGKRKLHRATAEKLIRIINREADPEDPLAQEILTELKNRTETSDLGGLLLAFRKHHKFSLRVIAEAAGLPEGTLYYLENRKVTTPRKRVVEGLKRAVAQLRTEDDPFADAILQVPKEKEEKGAKERELTREERWFQTITNVSYPLAIRCLTIEEMLGSGAFVKEAEISRSSLRRHKKGSFTFDFANQMIRAAGLDIKGKAAQLLRTKGAGSELMSRNKLNKSTPGELAKYIRIIIGLSQPDVERKTGLVTDVISNIENNKYPSKIREYVHKLIASLKLPINEPLVILLLQKVNELDEPVSKKVQISDEQFELTKNGRFVILENIQEIKRPPLSKQALNLLVKIETEAKSFGQAIKIVRLTKKMKQRELGERVPPNGISTAKIGDSEVGIYIPSDSAIARLAYALGKYSVHHPILWQLLFLAERDRERRKLKKKENNKATYE